MKSQSTDSVFLNLLFWIEILLVFALLVAVFFSLLYFSLSFIEERVSFISRFAQTLNIAIIIVSILIPFTNYGTATFLSTLAENICWFSVLTRGFPFIKLLSVDLIAGFILTLVSHLAWIFSFIELDTSAFIALCCYLFLVWSIPLLIVMTLPSTYDNQAKLAFTSQEKPKNLWHTLFSKYLPKLKSLLPHTGNKLE